MGIMAAVGMGALYRVAFMEVSQSDSLLVQGTLSFALSLFGSISTLRMVFYGAVIAHALEALYGAVLCVRYGASRTATVLYFVQNFIFGYPSLGTLMSQANKRK